CETFSECLGRDGLFFGRSGLSLGIPVALLFVLPPLVLALLALAVRQLPLIGSLAFEVEALDQSLTEHFDGRGHRAHLVAARTMRNAQIEVSIGQPEHCRRDLTDRAPDPARQRERNDQPEEDCNR